MNGGRSPNCYPQLAQQTIFVRDVSRFPLNLPQLSDGSVVGLYQTNGIAFHFPAPVGRTSDRVSLRRHPAASEPHLCCYAGHPGIHGKQPLQREFGAKARGHHRVAVLTHATRRLRIVEQSRNLARKIFDVPVCGA